MKFTINAKTFAALLAKLSRVIATRNTIPILDNFRITLTDGSVTVIASDVENTAFAGLSAVSSEGNGTFCINAKNLTSLAKSIGDQPMMLELNEGEAVISTATGRYTLPTSAGEDYPLPQIVDGSQITLTSSQLVRALNKTAWAASTEEIRPQLRGVCIDLKPEDIAFCATDTRKLCAYTLPHPCECPMTVILPTKAAKLAATLLPETDAIVDITIGEKAVSFTSSGISLTSVLIKGTFPSYERVIPADAPNPIALTRTELQCATTRVSAFSNDASRLVCLAPEADVLRVATNDPSRLTTATEKLPCEYSGAPLIIGFHTEYLAQVLSSVANEDVQLQITDPARPMKITEADEFGQLTVVLMPMNIPNE